MNRFLMLLCFVVVSLNVVAEEMLPVDTVKYRRDKAADMYIEYQARAQFPGGESALIKYVKESIQYPSDAIAEGFEGRVIVQFEIHADGSIGEVRIIRGRHPSLDKEAERIVNSLPNFIPAKSLTDGIPTESWFTLPITFKLPKEDTQK